MTVPLDELDAAAAWWQVYAGGDDYTQATTAQVLAAARGSATAAAHCAALERVMPVVDEWLVGELDRLAAT